MYTEDNVVITKTDDGGYILAIRVKRKKDKESKSDLCCGDYGRSEKLLVAKDIKEVKTILDKALPEMKAGGMEEDEFNEAFKEATEED